MAPRPVAAEHARQRNCRKAKAYRERLRQRKQARDCQTDVQIESVSRIDECAELIRETSPEASSVAYEASSQVVAEPTATASTPSCPNVSRSQAGTENGEPIPQDPGDPTNFATYSHENTTEAPEVSEQPIGEDREFASSTDPILIRREQTCLRVQRYRARQHKLRLEVAAATSDYLNAAGYTSQDDVLPGLQDLTIDEVPNPKVPAGRSSNASIHCVRGGTIESGSGYQSERKSSNLSEGDPSWSHNSDADLASSDGIRPPSRIGSHTTN